MLGGQGAKQGGQIAKVAVGKPEAAQRVALARVEAGRDHDQFRLEGFSGFHQMLLKGLAQYLGPPATGGKGKVEDVTLAGFASEPAAGVPRMLVRAQEHDGAVVVEDVLRAVAMVDVPIDNQHAGEPVLLLRVARADRNVVEDAEAHAARGSGVMARGPHGAEGGVGLLTAHQVDGAQHASHGFGRHLPGGLRDLRIAGRKLAQSGGDVFSGPCDVVARMAKGDLIFARDALFHPDRFGHKRGQRLANGGVASR